MKTLLAIISIGLLFTSLQAQDITTYSGQEKALEQRWNWAIEEADKKDLNKYWIVYTFEHLMNQNSYIGHFSRNHKNKVKLGEILYPGSPKDYFESMNYHGNVKNAKKINKEIAVLFSFRKDKIIESKISTIDMHFDLGKKPVLWLGLASEEESIKLITGEYSKIEDPEAKESLISAAGMHKNVSQSFDFLKEIIENEKDNELREDAVFWFGQLNNPKAIPFLKMIATNDRNEDVAEKAVFALYNIESEESIDAIIELTKKAGNHDVREKAIFWLGQIAGKKAAEALDDIVYSDEETDIQKKAVFAISQLDHGKGVPKLIKIAKTHPNPQIRKKAIFWLGESEDDRALDALIEMVQN